MFFPTKVKECILFWALAFFMNNLLTEVGIVFSKLRLINEFTLTSLEPQLLVLNTKFLLSNSNVFDVVLTKLKSQLLPTHVDLNILIFWIGVVPSYDAHTSHSVVDKFEQVVEANINELKNINIKLIKTNFLISFIFFPYILLK